MRITAGLTLQFFSWAVFFNVTSNSQPSADMKKEETPQDEMLFDGMRAACYATEKDGRYTLVQTTGWDPVNVANAQAWEFVLEQVQQVLAEIEAGEKSILAYHMERCQMNVSLLAKYVGLPGWRVRRHLKPKVFAGLKRDILERYAGVFQQSVEAFLALPESVETVISIPKV